MSDIAQIINNCETTIGIEFGSTRIKAVLADLRANPLASGSFNWENSFVDGVWTYAPEEFITGLQTAFAGLKADVKKKYGVTLTGAGAMGISGMMHGYLPFDKDGNQIAAFRTWRNTITERAAEKLSEEFRFNVPQRWSIAHLYESMLNKEAHVENITAIYTLAAYIHYLLTGNRVIGVGEASGMFPIDPVTKDYDKNMIEKFRALSEDYGWDIYDILPKVLVAGQSGGKLSEEGAKLLDPTGEFKAGVPMCAPEGDAGTGMVATNSVGIGTGNLSAGTSFFLMAVMEKALEGYYKEIDVVTTPAGAPVAMIHSNNGCGEIDSWAAIFSEMLKEFGIEDGYYKALDSIYAKSLDKAGNLNTISYNNIAGEVLTDIPQGNPTIIRNGGKPMNLSSFGKSLIYSAVAPIAVGKEIIDREGVRINKLMGHGGFFKYPEAGQAAVAAALKTPVTVMSTAGEGGPWGMAVLAGYMLKGADMPLEEYLDKEVFASQESSTIEPDAAKIAEYDEYLASYKACLPALRKIEL